MKYFNILWETGFAFLLFACVFVSSDTSAKEFSYDPSSPKGPSKWSSIKPVWGVCGAGKFQSPIDIPTASAKVSPVPGDLKQSYVSSAAVVKNRMHSIAVIWKGDAGQISVNGTNYKLLQCHWHSPSEHTFDGKKKDLELHVIHQTDLKETAGISILYQIGAPDPFLSKLMPSLKGLGEAEKDAGIVDPMDIGFLGKPYYGYMGSFTNPPCTEPVVWTVLKEVKTVSAEQIQALKDPLPKEFKENSRPVQPVGVRSISLYNVAGSPAAGALKTGAPAVGTPTQPRSLEEIKKGNCPYSTTKKKTFRDGVNRR